MIEQHLVHPFRWSRAVAQGRWITSGPFWRRQGWTDRLRLIAPHQDRASIDCLLTVAPAAALAGTAAVALSGGLAASPRVQWVLAAYALFVTVATVARARDRRTPSIEAGAMLADMTAALVAARLVPGLQIAAVPVFLSTLLAGSLRFGAAALPASGLAIASAWLMTRSESSAATLVAAARVFDATALSVVFAALVSPAVVWVGTIERRRRAEAAAARHLLAQAGSEDRFTAALQDVLEDLQRLVGARDVQLFAHDDASGRSYRCRLSGAPGSTTLRWSGVTGFALVAADAGSGGALRIPFKVGDWSGLLVLVDPAPEVDAARAARFISRTAADIVPALVSRGAVAALRERVTRHERARLERQLHDRVIQSLIAAEMSMAAFGRRAAPTAPDQRWLSEMTRVQHLLHEEILGLRDFMRELKPPDVRPDHLAALIDETVHRFARDTGIAATFTNAGTPAALPRRACAGIMRIVQEALTNVRKHSGAETVRVRLGSTPARAVILVEDDGRGFGFTGRLTLDAEDPCGPARERTGTIAVRGRQVTHAIPLVIRDSVLALGGQLTIESRPGRGASLQITIPVDSRMAAADVDRWMAS